MQGVTMTESTTIPVASGSQAPDSTQDAIAADTTSTFFPDTDAVTSLTTATKDRTSDVPSSSPPPLTTSSDLPSSSSNKADNNKTTHTTTDPTSTIKIILTHDPLSIQSATEHTRSPTAGATVLFVGTTRSYFQDPTRPVSRLSYTSYPALAQRTLLSLAQTVQTKHKLERVYVAHRLGEVAVAVESIVVAVSSAHRGPAWVGAEELLELVKERAEIWKREWFVDGVVRQGRDGEPGTEVVTGETETEAETKTERQEKGEEVGVWRDNRESDRMGQRR